MSMWDKSYCGIDCEQFDCERNLTFHKPETKYYDVAYFEDNSSNDKKHYNCTWKIKMKDVEKWKKKL